MSANTNKAVTLKAAAATPGAAADQSRPAPSPSARGLLLLGILVAVGAAIAMNVAGVTGKPFTPNAGAESFSLFAGFYVAAQIIERLLELVGPLLPVDAPGTGDAPGRGAPA